LKQHCFDRDFTWAISERPTQYFDGTDAKLLKFSSAREKVIERMQKTRRLPSLSVPFGLRSASDWA
jgi:hypothetical protein